MSLITDSGTGKRHSFFSLIKEEDVTIEIPIIQRDYAQGRKSKGELRDLFLESLYNYLNDAIPFRDLDFIYGSTEISSSGKKFIPLDGQQRLTTLFLLHWYLAQSSNNEDNVALFQEVLSQGNVSKFNYTTRTSSTDFCNALVKYKIDFKRLLPHDKNEFNRLSKTIRNESWYFLSWDFDPTIQSMLRMLDSIDSKFFGNAHFFNLLIDSENPVITFITLELNEFKLTEDLYIKMNSRGKPLTPFENFKAKVEQHIDILFPETSKIFQLDFDGIKLDVSTKEYFSFSIDTSWSNLFWQYRDLAGRDSTFDDELLNFIRILLTNQIALQQNVNLDDLLFLTKSETIQGEESVSISFNRLHSIHALSDKAILYLISSFDCLVYGTNKIKNHLTDHTYFDENKIFEKVLTHKITFPERIQFYAYLQYLIKNPSNIEGLHQWMRVVHNLTENTQLNAVDELEKGLKSIELISQYSSKIIEFLTQDDCKIDFFLGRQVQEEKIKAHLILKSSEWKEIIELTEKHHYLSGQILFVLEFSGILEFYELNGHCNWSNEENIKFFREVNLYSSKSIQVFSIIGTPANENYSWERAVLSKGDYLIPSTYNRYNFLNTSKYLRDYSWKRLMRLPQISDSIENIQIWQNRRFNVKSVFDDPLYDVSNLIKSLESICLTIPNDWRRPFVSNPLLLQYCDQGFLHRSDSIIQIMKHSKLNHRHRELYSFCFYLSHMKGKEILFLPFVNVDHFEISNMDEISCAFMNEWSIENKVYELNIVKTGVQNTSYKILFYINRGGGLQENYLFEIRSLIETNGFNWEEETSMYTILKSNDSETITFIQELCSKFKDINDSLN